MGRRLMLCRYECLAPFGFTKHLPPQFFWDQARVRTGERQRLPVLRPLAEAIEQYWVQQPAAGYDSRFERIERTAVQVADAAAGFLDKHGACRHVPSVIVETPVTIESPGSDIGKV